MERQSNFSILNSILALYSFPETLKSAKMVIPDSDFNVSGITNEANQVALLGLTLLLFFSTRLKADRNEYD